MFRLLLSLLLLVFLGCAPITVNEQPEREGDDPGECDDDADNDADGLFDCGDPDCAPAEVCACEDSDGDEVCDQDDACPGEDDRIDPDQDGLPSGCDVCPDDPLNDSDGDTVCDSMDVCLPGDDLVDHDGDGTPTDCDPCPFDLLDDSDGDGVCDSVDECPGGDDSIDLDDNGVPDDCDSGPGVLLLSDGNGTIYELDETGGVLAQWASPIAGLRGVTWDRAAGDGFWIVGSGALGSLTKLDWTGATVTTLVMNGLPGSPNDPRGLDYHVDPAGEDRLVLIGVEINGIDSLWNFGVGTGTRLLGSTHYSDGFLSGFWGVHQIGQNLDSDWARWTSWPDGTLQHWDGSQSFVSSVSTGMSSLRGLSVARGGDFWLVDAANNRVVHLSSTGTLLSEFPTPGSDPLGLSYWE
jgi:hypothetical protein